MKTTVRVIAVVGLILGLTSALSGCSAAVSNVQTIISDDCGENWRLVPVGSTIPARIGPCALRTAVPNYPMVGEVTFIGNFEGDVRVMVNASYDYTITDPLAYIQGARFVGRQGSTGEEPSNAASVWDTAENVIIDRQLRELANSEEFLLSEDIVDYNQTAVEDRLQTQLNAYLATRGVQLGTFTFVVTPDDQTRNMIDTAAALRVCLSIDGMERDDCVDMLRARAGAPRIIVETTSQN